MENKKPDLLDRLDALKKQYADVVDDVGFDIRPSRECPVMEKDTSVVSSLSGIIQLDENYDYKSDYTSFLEQKAE